VKVCTKCGEEKPLAEFNRKAAAADERVAQCRACKAAYCAAYDAEHREGRAAYRAEHREEKAAYSAARYAEHREERAAYGAAHRDEIRVRAWQRKYGISADDYWRLNEQQGGVCAICGEAETAKDHRTGVVRLLSVDHCHSTGRVRGLLCSDCNKALGHLGDSEETLRRAVAYLEAGEVYYEYLNRRG
jgi:hypothetical protein